MNKDMLTIFKELFEIQLQVNRNLQEQINNLDYKIQMLERK